MKGTGKLSGAVMQIAFILTALHFQSLISAPAMTSLCYFLYPPSFIPFLICPIHSLFPHFNVFFSISSPIFPLVPLLPSTSPYSFPLLPLHPSISISEELLLHLFACSRGKKKGERELIGGGCEWLRSLPLNRHSRGSLLENKPGVG